ncbi:MAG: hypothetical protein AAGJ91_05905 [Pseudomonadota bacterium]
MNQGARAARAADQLASLLRAERLPDSVRALGTRVQARLAAPVTLALVGWPEAAPAALANGLLGGPVLPEAEGLPPAELAFGTSEVWSILKADGSELNVSAETVLTYDPYDIALLRRAAPLPLLEQVSLRVAALEGTAEEMQAALHWALKGADMLVWCTASPAEDAAMRAALPDALQDHAFLAVRGSATADPGAFVAAHAVPFDDPSGAAQGAFRAALLRHVAQGRREDVECALMLLEQYLPGQARRTGVPDTAHPERDASAADPIAIQETCALGAEIVDLLAARADRIAHLIEAEGPLPMEEVLEVCAASLTAAADRAGVSERDAGLADDLAEAADLMMLLQMEGSPSALVDALALMLQARHVCEARLSA